VHLLSLFELLARGGGGGSDGGGSGGGGGIALIGYLPTHFHRRHPATQTS